MVDHLNINSVKRYLFRIIFIFTIFSMIHA
jgi:hypothetical protein